MLEGLKARWAKMARKSELRLLRKHYFRKTGQSIDKYTDAQVEEIIKIGEILKKHKISADDAIKYLQTAMDKERSHEIQDMG